jgi:hypothetical protein
VPLPVANVTNEIYRMAMREGYADLDCGSIYAFDLAYPGGLRLPRLLADVSAPGAAGYLQILLE